MITKDIAARCTEVLMRAAFGPVFAELERENGTRITAKLLCLVDGQPVAHAEYSVEASAHGAVGEIRFTLAESFQSALFNFSCQAIISGMVPSSGYSGFSMKGKVDLAGPGDEVRVKSRINHYNQWEWKREYAVR